MLDEADALVKAWAILINDKMKVCGLSDLKSKKFMMLSATFSDTEREILKVGLAIENKQIVPYKTQREIIAGCAIYTQFFHEFTQKTDDAFKKLRTHISKKCDSAPQFIFYDKITDKCIKSVLGLKYNVLKIDTAEVMNGVNKEGGAISTGIFFLHSDFARGLDLKLAVNADVTIFCNLPDSKMNSTLAC